MTTSDNTTPERMQSDTISTEELQAKADEVQRLREEVLEVQAQRVSNESALSNQITMTELEAEEARLKAQLATAKSQVEGGAVESAATPLNTAKENMEVAVRQQQAAEEAANATPEPVVDQPPVNEDPQPPASGVDGAFTEPTYTTNYDTEENR